ncbi:MAG: biotin--[acetyl-CoA-carboxylase] ligase [Planctomycetota bacterium]|nr:biotin--[acetyl-CoA-carboxylase] ligase [Planctomycetota bacterium]
MTGKLAVDDGSNRLDSARIVRESFVQQVRSHETIDSTNDDALEFCRHNSCPVPLLVATARQTAGRGRGSNQWWSSAGALTCSLVIQPANFGILEQQWPKASLVTGLSICLALDSLAGQQEVTLKWPNDVWMNGRKICGILIEVGGRRPAPTLVIGIGINVNNSFAGAPDELQGIATSLADTTGTVFDLTEVLVVVLGELERQLARLRDDDPQLAADWQARCALRGRSLELESGRQRVQGTCLGIDADGALSLQTPVGQERFFGGVITQIR